MPNQDDYYAFRSTGGGGGGGKGGGFGCSWVVIVAVVVLLISFILDGASGESIDCLLGWGLLAFLFAKSIF